MRRALLFLVFLIGCGAPAARSEVTLAAPSAKPAQSGPAGFRLETGPGYSLLVPEGWRRVHDHAGADVEFVGAGMTVYAGHMAWAESADEFVALMKKGAELENAEVVRSSTLEEGGRTIPVTELALVARAPTVRGIIRLEGGTQHIVSFLCHAESGRWETLRSGCDPIFATIRVGAAAKQAGTGAPPGMRWLVGSDWRIAVPSGWIDGGPTTNGVSAISRSGNDENRLLVVTVAEATPSRPLTRQTADELLREYAEDIVKNGTQATITAASPNVLTLDFTRKARSRPDITMIEATYVQDGVGYVVTCAGPPEVVAAHHALCDAAFRSMRIDGAK